MGRNATQPSIETEILRSDDDAIQATARQLMAAIANHSIALIFAILPSVSAVSSET